MIFGNYWLLLMIINDYWWLLMIINYSLFQYVIVVHINKGFDALFKKIFKKLMLLL